ncbi:MAG: NAD(P)-binding domain-containing protein [Burkholderiales bacterium]|nr:NAD(P)-binding domain-containing protein [Burkholderiales bacterium]MDE1926258.1 NAD(P)-binding domain-containing protein [Burkholderiales bacterium]MDE2502233.1 NAD(P)-binding domain-containing protein [Burkholderiales bacterium]
MDSNRYLIFYLSLAAFFVGWHVWRRRRRHRAELEQLRQSREAGLNEPPSLHPVVDPNRCLGSGACVKACPEAALGVVDGKAVLINAAACIGHGACYHACPVQALTLVFGTETRGIDIPQISAEFETNVAGVFIAGELGGMGLIRKTAEQGRQAMAAIQRRGTAHAAALDVVIVGAGPAGLSAGLSAMHHKLRYVLVEQEATLGGSVYHYPRNKIAMTAPVKLDLVGIVKLGTEVQKEKLLEFWNGIVARTMLKMNFSERFEGLERQVDGTFLVRTSRATYHANSVLLALGRRGTPRKLGVPGEEQAKVVYRLVDAAQYAGRSVLVVGGGDSALEAALALAAEAGTAVTLSYRGEAFARVKQKNREAFESEVAQQRIRCLLGSKVQRIDETSVTLLRADGQAETLANEHVIVCAGGELPTPLLKSIGIRFETKFGQV